MASVDLRITRAARRSRERWALYRRTQVTSYSDSDDRWKQMQDHDLEELRELLEDEVYNMQARFMKALRIYGKITSAEQRIFVKHLHMLTFDETYRDREPKSKNDRSRKRIESLIRLCHDDEELFLREYAQVLEKYFPVDSWSSRYVWKPRLFQKTLKSGIVRTSLKHHMGYRYRPDDPQP